MTFFYFIFFFSFSQIREREQSTSSKYHSVNCIRFGFHSDNIILSEVRRLNAAQTMFHRTFIIIFLYLSLMGLQSIELYDRLNYLIGYVKIHEESQNPDLMLGIYVCEGDLCI